MAAGSASSLLISDTYDGEYSYSTSLQPFVGRLEPVSTDKIQQGFQLVKEFKDGEEGQPKKIAYIFKGAEKTEFYHTSLYLKSTGTNMKVYVKNIGYTDSSKSSPISTAIRVGLVTYKPGNTDTVDGEYIFAINTDQHIQNPEYNTATGREGYVLDSTKTDGTTVEFTPYTSENYVDVDSATGEVNLKTNSIPVANCESDNPVKVDVYIWLEGCDEDCTVELTATTLSEASIEFAGVADFN